MLPFFTLQTVNLELGDLTRQGPELLPADATEPTALFAELLRVSADEAGVALPQYGMPLPVAGSALPTAAASGQADAPAEAGPERATTVANSARSPLTTIAVALRAELARAQRSATAAVPHAARDGAPPMVPHMGESAQPVAGTDRVELRPATDLPQMPSQRRDFASVEQLPRVPAESAPAPAVRISPDEVRTMPRPAAELARPVLGPAVDAAPRRDAAPTPDLPRDSMRQVRRDAALNFTPLTPRSESPQLASAQGLPGPAAPLPVPAATEFVLPPQGTTLAPAAVPLAPVTAAPPAEPAMPAPQLHSAINVAVQESAWGEQLGERVQLMANSRLQSAEIRLTPAELGPVRVQVAIDDGNATVTFHAQHALTRDAIEQAMPRLRELLSESGLTLQQASVGADDSRQGSLEAGAGERDAEPEMHASRDEHAAAEAAADIDDGIGPSRPRDGLVDTFA